MYILILNPFLYEFILHSLNYVFLISITGALVAKWVTRVAPEVLHSNLGETINVFVG